MLDIVDIPLSLYIHIPWCEKKCPYCDFNSHLARSKINQPDYVAALLDDLAQDLSTYAEALNKRKIHSVFIGGGTPSLFSPSSYAHLLGKLKPYLSNDVEITLEANPGSSEADKFVGFKEAGINRLSIGVQSFKQSHLSALGRVHSANEAINAARYAQAAGFTNFNLDLMFGLPEQSLEQSINDVQKAIGLNPSHLSCYQLTIEPNTLFHHHPPATPDHESLWLMQTAIQSELARAGFQQYEISAYARNTQLCRHNLNYWQFGDYLGIGAGAHSKITNTEGVITRNWKIKHPAAYLSAAKKHTGFVGGSNAVNGPQAAFEFMMNALRLRAGFDLNLFTQRTGLSNKLINTKLNKHQKLGLINIDKNHVTPTPRGHEMLDSLLQDYLPDS